METYQTEVKCKNCKRNNWITGIPKGKTVEEHCFSLAEECRVCGCDLFTEKEEKETKEKKSNDKKENKNTD